MRDRISHALTIAAVAMLSAAVTIAVASFVYILHTEAGTPHKAYADRMLEAQANTYSLTAINKRTGHEYIIDHGLSVGDCNALATNTQSMLHDYACDLES